MPQAALEIFGYPPTPARAEVLQRGTSWRATRALLAAGIGVGTAPVLFLIPPHVPWAAGSILIGLYLARSRWTERCTLLALEGECPACGASIRLARPERLRRLHSTHCGHCGREVAIDVT